MWITDMVQYPALQEEKNMSLKDKGQKYILPENQLHTYFISNYLGKLFSQLCLVGENCPASSIVLVKVLSSLFFKNILN